MGGDKARRIEFGADAAAAAAYAAGTALILNRLDATNLYSLVAASIAFAAAFYALRSVEAERKAFAVRVFRPAEFEPFEPDELVLTEADRLQDPLEPAELVLTDADRLQEPLELKDVLAEIRGDARVVRLFDPTAMPTAGQAKARVDGRFGEGAKGAAPPDASQALYDALNELRRSIR